MPIFLKDIIGVKVMLINFVVVLKSVKLRLGLRLSLTDFGQAAPSDLLAALAFLSLS